MNKFKKTAILMGVVCTLSGCQIGDTVYVLSKPKIIENDTLLSVNNCKKKLPEAMIYLCNYKNLYGNVFGINLWSYEFEEDSLEEYVKDVAISELTRITCMDILAEEREMELSEEEQENAKKAAEAYYSSLSQEEISFMQIQESDVLLAYENYATAVKFYNTLTNGVEKEVSDDEARVIRIQQIRVTDKDDANIVSEKLKSGEDFSTVAGTYNEEPSIEITVKRGELPEEVEDVAYDLDNDTISDAIQTEDAYYFIKCLNKYEEELTEENKEVIRECRQKEQFENVYESFVANAAYELNEEMWEAVSFGDSIDSLTTSDFFSVYNEYFN